MSWETDALCRGRTDLFYGPPSERPEARDVRGVRAQQMCGKCPVKHHCFLAGRREHFGVWGGVMREGRTAEWAPIRRAS